MLSGESSRICCVADSIPPVPTINAPVVAATNWLATLPVLADSSSMEVDEPTGDASWIDILCTWSPQLGRRRLPCRCTLQPSGLSLPSCRWFILFSTPAAQVAEQYRNTQQQLLDAAACAAMRAADAAQAAKPGSAKAPAAQRPSTDVLLLQPSLSAYSGTYREFV